jgi:hypothetical protein
MDPREKPHSIAMKVHAARMKVVPYTAVLRRKASELRPRAHQHGPSHPSAIIHMRERRDPPGMKVPRGLLSLVHVSLELSAVRMKVHGVVAIH